MMLGAALKEKVCTRGLPAPAGNCTWLSRWLTASRSSLVLESTLNWTWTCEKLWLDVAKTCCACGSPLSALDIGMLTSRSITAGLAPASLVTMKTLGKSMEGRSSWLSRKMLKIPAAIKTAAKRMTTGRLPRHQATIRLKCVLLFRTPARAPSLCQQPPRGNLGHQLQIEEAPDILHFGLDTSSQRTIQPFGGLHANLAAPGGGLSQAPRRHGAAVDDHGGVKPSAAALQATLQRWGHGQVASPIAEQVGVERRQKPHVGLRRAWFQPEMLFQREARTSLDHDPGENAARSTDGRTRFAHR